MGNLSLEDKYKELKKLAYNMYIAAKYINTDASELKKAMNEYHHFVVYELNKNNIK